MLGNLVWALSRPPIGTRFNLVETGRPAHLEDHVLLERIGNAYKVASADHQGTASFWNTFTEGIKKNIHLALSSTDVEDIAKVLRRPDQNTHFWGFDAICKAPEGQVEPHELVFRNLNEAADWQSSYALWLHGALINLAEAVGALRMMYPETTPGYHYEVHGEPSNLDAVLSQVEVAIGMPFDFPNPYPGETGLQTSRGVVGFRALQAIYQAWRVSQIVKGRPNPRILEIGAGLGRTAYYAHRFGLTDYTILDIPLTGAAQSYFLGRTLGEAYVALVDEKPLPTQIKVLPPESLTALEGRFDLILNVDSFTELDQPTAQTYWTFAKDRGDFFLSINHEFNPQPFREFYKADAHLNFTRHPYWMRRGYVEELVTFNH